MTNEVTTGTEETTAAETSVVDQTAASTTPADITASAEPAAPATDDVQNAGDIDFGAILEQFEQEQTIFHPGELVEGKVVGISDRGF
ncbi:MAG: hypothetical protein IPP63_20495 [Chloracidobacterium sp.]|nr:hypothetical protein [Chloracidobacterium sp.]